MKKKTVLFSRFLIGFFSVMLVSCNDVDILNVSKEVQIQESLVLPVGQVTVSLGDLFSSLGTQTNIGSNADSIYLQISDSANVDFPVLDFLPNISPLLLTFNPFPVNQTLNPPYEFPVIETTNSFYLGVNTDVAVQRIDSVWINTLKFDLTLNSTMLAAGNYSYKITFPDNKLLYKTGNPVIVQGTFQNFNQPVSVTLSNLVLKTIGTSSLPVKAEVFVIPGNTPLNVGPTSKIDLSVEVKEINYDLAFGLISPQVVNGQPLQLSMDFTTALHDALPNFTYAFKLANPKIDIQIVSNVGSWLRFDIEHVAAFNSAIPDVKVYANFGGSNSTTERLTKPIMNGVTVHDFKQLNRSWGATNLLFDLTKDFNTLEYKWTVQNDLDSINAHPLSANYVHSVPKFMAKLKLSVPLYFDAGTFLSMSDTIHDIGTNISSALGDNSVDSAVFVLTIKNGIPLKLKFELTNFLDALGSELNIGNFDKVYTIDAPVVNQDGLSNYNGVKNFAETKIYLNIEKNQIEEFKKLKNLIFKLTVDGKTDDSPIQLTKDNTLSVKAGIFVKGTATMNFNN